MRLGLYGLSEHDAAGAPWRALAASVGGVVTDAVVVGPGEAPVGARARWDAVLVCAALAIDARTAAAGALPAALRALVAFARAGGPVLGAGGGFQSLCALGLLPGRVVESVASPGPVGASDAREAVDDQPMPPAPSPAAHLRVEGRRTPFTSAIPAGRVMRLQGATVAAGLRYDVAEPEALSARGQVIFRYCDAAGGTRARSHGQAIAGVCDDAGNVVGLLADPAAMGGEGAQLLGSLRLHLGGRR